MRVSKTEFVNKRLIQFDVDAIDTALADFCPGDYLPLMSVSSATNEQIKEKIDGKYTLENIATWRAEKEAVYNAANTLEEILRVFNFKDLSKKVGSQFGLSDRDFPKRVLNVLGKNSETKELIRAALSNYIPQLP